MSTYFRLSIWVCLLLSVNGFKSIKHSRQLLNLKKTFSKHCLKIEQSLKIQNVFLIFFSGSSTNNFNNLKILKSVLNVKPGVGLKLLYINPRITKKALDIWSFMKIWRSELHIHKSFKAFYFVVEKFPSLFMFSSRKAHVYFTAFKVLFKQQNFNLFHSQCHACYESFSPKLHKHFKIFPFLSLSLFLFETSSSPALQEDEEYFTRCEKMMNYDYVTLADTNNNFFTFLRFCKCSW